MWSLLLNLGQSRPAGDLAPSFAAAHSGAVVRNIDSKSLAKLMDLFGSGAALA